jgi:hypothetical protein
MPVLESQVVDVIMSDPISSRGQDSRFQQLYENGGFWSCCGYDGLSVAFDLPLDAVRSLSEEQKQALIRLITRLAKTSDDQLHKDVRRLDNLDSGARLSALLQISAPFLP